MTEGLAARETSSDVGHTDRQTDIWQFHISTTLPESIAETETDIFYRLYTS